MRKNHVTIVFAAIVSVVAFSAFSIAATGAKEYSLMPTEAHPNASGTARIDSNNININANGLNPDSVYTVWFVSMKPQKHEAGAGEAPYMFRTDADGSAVYKSELYGSPFGKWEMVMIMLHPTGNPKDMNNMVGALGGKL